MRNNCCGFNLCPLIIALFLGAAVAILVYLGIITILPTIIPYLLLVIGIIFFLLILLIMNLDSINSVIQQNDCCGRFCCDPCCICPLIRSILIALIIAALFLTILIFTGVAATNVIIALLVFIAITAFIFMIFGFIRLIFCLLDRLCND